MSAGELLALQTGPWNMVHTSIGITTPLHPSTSCQISPWRASSRATKPDQKMEVFAEHHTCLASRAQ